jgi:N4-gp56 family major capsid protein
MGIQNFPAALQPIIQQGFLDREFQNALRSRLGYRACADREDFPVGIGETLTKTRAGLKPAVTTPLAPAANTNMDNGLTPQGWAVEQYTVTINHYAATTDLNMVTSRVGIVGQFLQNAYANGEQAARSLDELARNALFGAYLGGATRVRTSLTSAGPNVAVDDIRGFQSSFLNGVPTPIGASSNLTVTVGSNSYTLVGAAADATNVSTSPSGVSGVLTFSGNVSVADGQVGNAVQGATSSLIVRPNARTTSAGLVAGDTLSMGNLLDAVAFLRRNAVPTIDGAYNCYIDPVSSRQIFSDPDFKLLYQGTAASANSAYANGVVSDFLGIRFVPTTEAPVQPHPTIANAYIRRPILCGKGALIEADFAGMGANDVAPEDAIVSIIDNIAMVTREPLDRLQQIIAQSWYWIGGFCAPTDTTTNPSTVPTATNAAYKRAVVIEHIG